jgi:hypothetical protein
MEAICHGSHTIGELFGVCDERVIVAGVPADGPAVIEDNIVVA